MSLTRNHNSSGQHNQHSSPIRPSYYENLAGSFLATVIGYPPVHMITAGIVRWQASVLPATSLTPAISYEIIFKKPYNGITSLPSHVSSLLNGGTAGFLNKGLQNVVRYPAQKYFTKKIDENSTVKNNIQALAGDESDAVIRALGGSGAAISEGVICQPFDTARNLIMTAEQKMSYKEMANLVIEKKMKLYNGLRYTLLRNGIGGFVQFGTYGVVMKYAFNTTDKAPTTSQVATGAWLAAAVMIFVTMPLDNKKLRKQLEATGTYSGFSSLFKGAVPKILTKSIGPTIFLTLGEIFTRRIHEFAHPDESVTRKDEQSVTTNSLFKQPVMLPHENGKKNASDADDIASPRNSLK